MVGDHLSLLCGNNEFLQKVLLSELRSRYYELTTVAKSTSAAAIEVCSAIKPPKRAPLNFVTVSLSKGTTPVHACPDTGAEVSLLSTAVLDLAGVNYDFEKLPAAYPVKGIAHEAADTRTFRCNLTF